MTEMKIANDFKAAPYGITRTFEGRTFNDVVAAVRAGLPSVGFGILTEIDVKATFKKKLNVDRLPYIILGACSPKHAHAVLEIIPSAGLFLPCNIVVAEDESGSVTVSAIDAEMMFQTIQHPQVEPIAAEVRKLLAGVIEAL